MEIDYYGEVLVGCIECNSGTSRVTKTSSWS